MRDRDIRATDIRPNKTARGAAVDSTMKMAESRAVDAAGEEVSEGDWEESALPSSSLAR